MAVAITILAIKNGIRVPDGLLLPYPGNFMTKKVLKFIIMNSFEVGHQVFFAKYDLSD